MPPYLPAQDDATVSASHRHRHRDGDASTNHKPHPQATPKLNQTILSMILKPLIMFLVTSLFFLFLGFAALVLLHLCLAGGFCHRRRAFHNHHHQFPPPSSPDRALSPRDLRKLPKFRHPGNDAGSLRDQTTICAICLDGFRRGQRCRTLPACGHIFHRSCVDSWLVKVAGCPICRSPVIADSDCSGDWADNQGRKLPFWLCYGSN